jgi:peptide/nickel transport system substrate-binding protein
MFDDDMEPIMHLAESVTPSADGLTWTITIRRGVKFHDGSDFTAEVAAYNLERLYRWNSATRAFDPEFARAGPFGAITGFNVISDYVFTVTHAAPIPDFDARLSLENSAMFAMASFDGEDRVIRHPYGTGPFYYAEYDEPNQILRLENFAGYRLGVPNVDTIFFYNIPDASTRLAALQSGEIDVISDVGGIMPQQAAAVLADPNLILKERQVSTIHYVALNNNDGRLFSDVRMRNAISLSIDRNTIVDFLLLGYGVEAISVITDLSANWVVDCGYRFDPGEAKALVDAAGGSGTEAVILVNSGLTGRWPYQDVAVMLQSQLVEIGINARIETADSATWTERMREGDYDITIHPFTVSAGEPNLFFVHNIASNGSNNISRNYGISNPEIDDLIARTAIEGNVAARRQNSAEIQRRVRANDYIIPVWYDVTLYAMNNRVINFNLDVLFCPDLFVVDIAH